MNVPFGTDPFLTIRWLECIWAFFDSNFFTALSGAGLGAFAGAYIAQRIAKKSKYRDELLQEIRNTNSAIMVANSICDSVLAMKQQHVVPLEKAFNMDHAAFLAFTEQKQTKKIAPDAQFPLVGDLRLLSLPLLPVGVLQNQVFDKLSLGGRPILLTTRISQTAEALSESLEKRNHLIDSFKRHDPPFSTHLYFGLKLDGFTDAVYPTTLHGIIKQTDNLIFFSHLLFQDLIEHGKEVAALFRIEFGKGAPNVNESNFSTAKLAGLMPKDEDYPDWFSKFAKHTKPEPVRRLHSLWKAVQKQYRKAMKKA